MTKLAMAAGNAMTGAESLPTTPWSANELLSRNSQRTVVASFVAMPPRSLGRWPVNTSRNKWSSMTMVPTQVVARSGSSTLATYRRCSSAESASANSR